MSYSVMSQCHACEKKDTCKDLERLKEGVQEVHSKSYDEGHQGGGAIVLQCNRQIAVQGYK